MRNLCLSPALLIALVCCLCISTDALAQDEMLINYQGYLTDDSGSPLSGDYSMTFTIYDAAGDQLWSQIYSPVPVDDGAFFVVLGAPTGLPTPIFNGEHRYLGIQIGEDPEISPRTLLTSVPMAAAARGLVGFVETAPGQLVLMSESGAPGITMSSNATLTGIEWANTAADGFIGIGKTSGNFDDIFGNIEEFTMGGNLRIGSGPDAAGLLVTHGASTDPPDLELRAGISSNAVRLHPPEPCVTPETCEPAAELVAEPDQTILRLHPPDPCVPPDPCGTPVELYAHTDYSGLILNHNWEDYPTTPSIGETRITAGDQTVDFDIVVSVPDADDVTPISIGTDVAVGSSHLSVKSPDGLASFNLLMNNDDGVGGGSSAVHFDLDPAGKVMGVEPSPFHPGYSLMMYDPASATPTAPKLEMNCGSEGTGIDIWDEIGKVMGTEPSPFNNGYAMKLFDPHAAVETPIVEISSFYGDGAFGKVNIGWRAPPDDNHPGVEITSTPSHGKILVGGTDDGTGAAKMIVLQANAVAQVGIGTDSPSEALHVVGNAYITGDVYAMTDTKAKTNVIPIDNALDKVEQLNGVTYDLQGDVAKSMGEAATGRKVGFLAHNVEAVLPEAVKLMNDGNRAVDYSRLTALLVEAVKELKAENDDLRARVEALEGQ